MLRKMTSILALVAAPFTASQADNTLPNVLAGLDSSIQVMDEQQLNEVRGAGTNLPKDFAYREYYFTYNNYGNIYDYRSYFQNGSSTDPGGRDYGYGAIVGEQWETNNLGVVEQRLVYVEETGQDPDGSTNYYAAIWNSGSDWTRGWDGKYRIFYNYNYYVQ